MTRIFSLAALVASLLLACGNGSSNTDGGTGTGGGTSGGGTGGCPAVAAGGGTAGYCNGSQVQTAACANVYVAIYPESSDIRAGCDSTFDSLSDAGTALPALGGILDTSSYSSQAGLLTVFPSGCEDLGIGSAPVISATAFTPPTGATTVAAVRTAQAVTTVYGIVTYVDAPFYNTTTMASEDALLYLQDQPGASGTAPLSGISVYIDDMWTTSTGTNGYPDGGVTRGDVVSISGLTWSPYDGQDQLAWGSSAELTVLGTQPLPTAVSLSSSDIAGTKGQQYLGMRITQSDAPDKVVSGCPAVLYQTTGG
jgi:hypothetical protein